MSILELIDERESALSESEWDADDLHEAIESNASVARVAALANKAARSHRRYIFAVRDCARRNVNRYTDEQIAAMRAGVAR